MLNDQYTRRAAGDVGNVFLHAVKVFDIISSLPDDDARWKVK